MTGPGRMAPGRPTRWRRRSLVGMAGVAAIAAAVSGVPCWALPEMRQETGADGIGCPSLEAVSFEGAVPAQTLWRSRLRPDELARGFGVQYWGDGYSADDLASAPQGLLILEPARASGAASPDGRELWFTPAEVAGMRSGGRRVLAYLNVSKVEHWRDYAIEEAARSPGPAPWLAGTTPDGDPLAAFWTDAWRDVLLERLDRILDAGFDGVMLDDVLQYHDWGVGANVVAGAGAAERPADAAGYARAMMALIEALRERADARRCRVILVANNGIFISRDAGMMPSADLGEVSSYLGAIDAILAESLITPREQTVALDVLREDYLRRGVPVLLVEFISNRPGIAPAETVAAVRERARELGFLAYVARDHAFNRLEPPLTAATPVRQREAQR